MTWVKGQSGNAIGFSRQQASTARRLAQRIGELTKDGDDIVQAFVEIAIPERKMRTNSPAEQKTRLIALQWLSDHHWGKAPQEIALQIGVSDEARRLRPLPQHALEALAQFEFLDAPALCDGTSDALDAEFVDHDDDDEACDE